MDTEVSRRAELQLKQSENTRVGEPPAPEPLAGGLAADAAPTPGASPGKGLFVRALVADRGQAEARVDAQYLRYEQFK